MKTKVLFLLTILLTLSTVNAQRVNGARVGYIDMEYILENVTAYQEANKQLEAKAQRWKGEIQKKQNTIEQMQKNIMERSFFGKQRRFLLQKLVRDGKGLKSNLIGVHTTVLINTYNKMSKRWEKTSFIERLYISVNRKANALILKQKSNLKEKSY